MFLYDALSCRDWDAKDVAEALLAADLCGSLFDTAPFHNLRMQWLKQVWDDVHSRWNEDMNKSLARSRILQPRVGFLCNLLKICFDNIYKVNYHFYTPPKHIPLLPAWLTRVCRTLQALYITRAVRRAYDRFIVSQRI